MSIKRWEKYVALKTGDMKQKSRKIKGFRIMGCIWNGTDLSSLRKS